MFLERIEKPRIRKNGTLSQRPQVFYRFKCDECEKIYDKRPHNVSVSKSGLHFCSNACKIESRHNGGKLREHDRQSFMTNYGVTHPMSSDIFKEKRKMLFQQRYGKSVTSPLQVPGALAKSRRTHLERYGVEHTFQVDAFKQKRNATWVKNLPHSVISKAELKCKTLLESNFGLDNIVHQKWVNGHPIDFYIKNIDTYVQFDGVYWHGLDRPIEKHQLSSSLRSQAIYQKWLIDKEQNIWFKEHNLKLVRITDQDSPEVIIEKLTK
jgi:hypothetical protein